MQYFWDNLYVLYISSKFQLDVFLKILKFKNSQQRKNNLVIDYKYLKMNRIQYIELDNYFLIGSFYIE
jgi:hypothetical protein